MTKPRPAGLTSYNSLRWSLPPTAGPLIPEAVLGRPSDHSICRQCQAPRLLGLLFKATSTDRALVGIQQVPLQFSACNDSPLLSQREILRRYAGSDKYLAA